MQISTHVACLPGLPLSFCRGSNTAGDSRITDRTPSSSSTPGDSLDWCQQTMPGPGWPLSPPQCSAVGAGAVLHYTLQYETPFFGRLDPVARELFSGWGAQLTFEKPRVPPNLVFSSVLGHLFFTLWPFHRLKRNKI